MNVLRAPCTTPALLALRTLVTAATTARQRRRTPPRSPIWKSPLRSGKVKAYDEALKYVRADSQALRRELAQLPRDERHHDRIRVLQVQSEINLPEVRYAFKTGRCASPFLVSPFQLTRPDPFHRPVYRHLAEQRWRQDGTLDLLVRCISRVFFVAHRVRQMERLYQMHVVPDLLPAIHPTVDFRVQFPYAGPRTAHQRAREKGGFSTIEPGLFLTPTQVRAQRHTPDAAHT